MDDDDSIEVLSAPWTKCATHFSLTALIAILVIFPVCLVVAVFVDGFHVGILLGALLLLLVCCMLALNSRMPATAYIRRSDNTLVLQMVFSKVVYEFEASDPNLTWETTYERTGGGAHRPTVHWKVICINVEMGENVGEDCRQFKVYEGSHVDVANALNAWQTQQATDVYGNPGTSSK